MGSMLSELLAKGVISRPIEICMSRGVLSGTVKDKNTVDEARFV